MGNLYYEVLPKDMNLGELFATPAGNRVYIVRERVGYDHPFVKSEFHGRTLFGVSEFLLCDVVWDASSVPSLRQRQHLIQISSDDDHLRHTYVHIDAIYLSMLYLRCKHLFEFVSDYVLSGSLPQHANQEDEVIHYG